MINDCSRTVGHRKMIRDINTIILQFHLQKCVQLLEIHPFLQRLVTGCMQYVRDHFIQQLTLIHVSILQDIAQGCRCIRNILSGRYDRFRNIRPNFHLPFKMSRSTRRTHLVTGIFHYLFFRDMSATFHFFRQASRSFNGFRIGFQVFLGLNKFHITACLLQASLYRLVEMFTTHLDHLLDITYLQVNQAEE